MVEWSLFKLMNPRILTRPFERDSQFITDSKEERFSMKEFWEAPRLKIS